MTAPSLSILLPEGFSARLSAYLTDVRGFGVGRRPTAQRSRHPGENRYGNIKPRSRNIAVLDLRFKMKEMLSVAGLAAAATR